jgi:hypothetical protein
MFHGTDKTFRKPKDEKSGKMFHGNIFPFI